MFSCSSPTTKSGQAENEKDPKKEKKDKDQVAKKDDSTADGWWCISHGIPEDECIMCNPKAEQECRAKGEWCEKHDRAKSQCFKCEGGKNIQEKYAAKYREHYNTTENPPPITD